MKRFLWFLLPIVLSIILWEFISHSAFVSPALFPPPSKVATALWVMIKTKTLFLDVRVSIWRLFAGLSLGSAFGILFGLLTGRIKAVSRAVTPIVQIFRSLPPVAIIPLVIVWFGIDNGAKIFSIAFAVFFPVWINAHMGAQRIPRVYRWSARLLTNSPIKIFRKVIFPATLPFIVAGIRNGIAIAFIMVFVSELTGASSGLGYRISISHLTWRIDEMMAALIVLGTLGAITDRLFIFIVNKLFPWLKLSSQ